MKSLIWVNSDVGFGRPCIRGTGIRTAVVLERWLAGEAIEDIAADYALSVEQILAAVHFELGRSRSKAAREALS